MESRDGQDVLQPVVVPASGPSWKRRWLPRLIVWAVVLGLLAIFIAQNFDTVDVHLFLWDVSLELAWALLIAAGLGFVLGLLLPLLRRTER